ncbi:MAG: AAA family ATPase [Candidatus Sericytochromatia bacterium]
MNTLIKNNQILWDEVEKQIWAKEMSKCPQEPDYHAEGDVLTHTRMVIEEIYNLEEFTSLEQEEKEILLLSALLHDIAKPNTTIIENNKISSPKHSKLGEKIVRELFWNLDFEKREQLASLVRLHGLPVWSITKENINKSVILSSFRVSNKLLYLLAKADMKGRISEFKDDLILNVDLFKELCLDNDCFYTEKTFYNEHSKFKFYLSDNNYPIQLYDDTEFEVVILCGLPGSGKDFYASSLDLPIVSLDELRKKYKIKRGNKKEEGRIIQEAYELARIFCRKKQSFVWNSTNITYEMRSKIINTLKVYNPKFKIVYLETSLENTYHRRKEDIPQKDLYKLFRMIDIPQKYEAHEVIYLKN